MPNWDYLIMNYVGDLNWADLQQHLIDEYGSKGWELCTVTHDVHYQNEFREEGNEPSIDPHLFIFKKPLEE
ncbi:MAG: hypothetical protein ACXABF_13130 [Candidatus Thorarchaeota archaeon]